MALFGKYRGNPLGRDLLHRGKNVQLVIDEHIVIGRIKALHVIELAFLVNKPSRDVLCKGDARIAFDRDVIVVVVPAKIVQGQMTGL